MIAVFNPSLPNKASTTGNPTKEVFPKPAVMIKQPVNFLDQPKCFPSALKNRYDIKKVIQAMPIGYNKSVLSCIFGI